jgi:uncharacterized membrane protein
MESNVLSSYAEAQASALPPATGSSKLNVGKTERILSVVAGTVLATLAIRSLQRTSGKTMGGISLFLLKRGVTGYCEVNTLLKRNTVEKKASAIEANVTFTINKPREEVYAFWRNFENLPRFMHHLKDVEVLDEKTSSWTAKLAGGLGTVSWQAVLEEEAVNSFLSWSSLSGSSIDNAGEVRFIDARGNEGTEVQAKISYRLPAGDLGTLAGKMVNPVVENMIREDLRRLKNLLEKGEAAAIEAQQITGIR